MKSLNLITLLFLSASACAQVDIDFKLLTVNKDMLYKMEGKKSIFSPSIGPYELYYEGRKLTNVMRKYSYDDASGQYRFGLYNNDTLLVSGRYKAYGGCAQRGMVMIGRWTQFYLNGNIKTYGEYKEGTYRTSDPTGTWRFYKKDGTLLKKKEYK